MRKTFALVGLFIVSVISLSCSEKIDQNRKISPATQVQKQIPNHDNIDDKTSKYYISDISLVNIGTYLPKAFIKEFDMNKKYYEAMTSKEMNSYHIILAVNKNIIYSNELFHDQYAIENIETNNYTFRNNNGNISLFDSKGNEYIRISSDTDYYREMRIYLLNKILGSTFAGKDGKIKTQGDCISYNNEQYYIGTDLLTIPEEDSLMIINKVNEKKYGLIKYENRIEVYSLSQGEEIRYMNDKKIDVIAF